MRKWYFLTASPSSAATLQPQGSANFSSFFAMELKKSGSRIKAARPTSSSASFDCSAVFFRWESICLFHFFCWCQENLFYSLTIQSDASLSLLCMLFAHFWKPLTSCFCTSDSFIHAFQFPPSGASIYTFSFLDTSLQREFHFLPKKTLKCGNVCFATN